MEKYKIGTPATSAGIIQNLVGRKFVKLDKNQYISTELGRNLLKYIPAVLKSPNMTVEFEEKLQKVNSGEVSTEQFIQELLDGIAGNKKYFLEHLPAEKLGPQRSVGKCPACGGSMREGKRTGTVKTMKSVGSGSGRRSPERRSPRTMRKNC